MAAITHYNGEFVTVSHMLNTYGLVLMWCTFADHMKVLTYWYCLTSVKCEFVPSCCADVAFLCSIQALEFKGWVDPVFVCYFSLSIMMGFVLMYSIMICTQYNSALTTTIIGVLKVLIVSAGRAVVCPISSGLQSKAILLFAYT